MTLEAPAVPLPPDAPPGPWFHNLILPNGTGGTFQTAPNHPLGDFPRFKWEAIEPHVPADLSGVQALDVGCNAGFYSLELAKRGAAVTALDHDPRYLNQARWAASKLELPNAPAFREGSVYDLSRPRDGEPDRFGLIWFMGVLYHLRHPLLALDILAERCEPGGLMVFQTLTLPEARVSPKAEVRPDLGFGGVENPKNVRIGERDRLRSPGWPTLAFVEHEFEDDPTNWLLADAPACRAMLRTAGFEIETEIPDQEVFVCRRREDAGYVDGLRRAELRAACGLPSR